MAGVLAKLSEALEGAIPEARETESATGTEFRRRVDREAAKRAQELVAEAVKSAELPLKERIAHLEKALAHARERALVIADEIEREIAAASSPSLPKDQPRHRPGTSKPVVSVGPTRPKRSVGAMTANGVSPAQAPNGEEDLPGARRRILATLVSMENLGIGALGHKNLAVFSGQGPRSSAYAAHLAALRKEGYVEYPEPGRASLTTVGRAVALGLEEEGANEPLRWERPGSLRSLHAAWYAHLPDAQGRLLSVLIERYPADVPHEELARLAGQSPNSSAYAAHRAALKHLGLVEYPRPGNARATRLLFPEGLT
jgi:hypothetical protein